MLFILEVALIVTAWKRGWGPRALIPAGCSFCIGFVEGLSGCSQQAAGLLEFSGLAELVAVIVMAAVAPADAPRPAPAPAAPTQWAPLCSTSPTVEAYCPYCGGQRAPGWSFCRTCGSRLDLPPR